MSAMEKQSKRISVDKLCVALVTADTSAVLTHDTPIELKGVTDVTVAKNSSKLLTWSDGTPDEPISQDGITTVTFVHDGLTSMLNAYITGASYDAATGLHKEGIGEVSPALALGYRSQKANGFYKYTWFYKGYIAKPDEANSTYSDSLTPQLDTYVFTAVKPIFLQDDPNGLKQSYFSDDENAPAGLTDTLLIVPETGWFSDPQYTPVAPGTALADVAGVSGASAGYIALTFTAPAGATSIYAQVKDPVGSVWMTVDTVAAITAASTSAVITGLTPGNTYDVRLVVIGGTKAGISNVDEDVVALAA